MDRVAQRADRELGPALVVARGRVQEPSLILAEGRAHLVEQPPNHRRDPRLARRREAPDGLGGEDCRVVVARQRPVAPASP